MSERCGYAVVDDEGIEGPCDREATGWRWYEDCGHEETLEPACMWHENESGRRLHAVKALAESLLHPWDSATGREILAVLDLP